MVLPINLRPTSAVSGTHSHAHAGAGFLRRGFFGAESQVAEPHSPACGTFDPTSGRVPFPRACDTVA
jgi:hypothetical protein